MAGLTLKQQRFADEYIISGNLYKSAIAAGYSMNYAKAQSSKLLENVGIKHHYIIGRYGNGNHKC